MDIVDEEADILTRLKLIDPAGIYRPTISGIIGMVDIIDCVDNHESNFFGGPNAKTGNIRVILAILALLWLQEHFDGGGFAIFKAQSTFHNLQISSGAYMSGTCTTSVKGIGIVLAVRGLTIC